MHFHHFIQKSISFRWVIFPLKFSSLFYTLSTDVTDPITYEQLKAGTINLGSYITVFESAKANLLRTEPKFFTGRRFKIVRFIYRDFEYNLISLRILESKVSTDFQLGTNLTLGLPNAFNDYTLKFTQLALVSDADLDYILTWTEATRLVIADNSNAVVRLLWRVDDMRALNNLKFLGLTVQKANLERMRLEPFMQTLDTVKHMEFVFDRDISKQEMEAFLAEQIIPKAFERINGANDKVASYERLSKTH